MGRAARDLLCAESSRVAAGTASAALDLLLAAVPKRLLHSIIVPMAAPQGKSMWVLSTELIQHSTEGTTHAERSEALQAVVIVAFHLLPVICAVTPRRLFHSIIRPRARQPTRATHPSQPSLPEAFSSVTSSGACMHGATFQQHNSISTC